MNFKVVLNNSIDNIRKLCVQDVKYDIIVRNKLKSRLLNFFFYKLKLCLT